MILLSYDIKGKTVISLFEEKSLEHDFAKELSKFRDDYDEAFLLYGMCKDFYASADFHTGRFCIEEDDIHYAEIPKVFRTMNDIRFFFGAARTYKDLYDEDKGHILQEESELIDFFRRADEDHLNYLRDVFLKTKLRFMESATSGACKLCELDCLFSKAFSIDEVPDILHTLVHGFAKYLDLELRRFISWSPFYFKYFERNLVDGNILDYVLDDYLKEKRNFSDIRTLKLWWFKVFQEK